MNRGRRRRRRIDALRTKAEDDISTDIRGESRRPLRRQVDNDISGGHSGNAAIDCQTRIREEVHCRRSEEACDKHIRRRMVESQGRITLLKHTVLHDRDTLTHCHRFDLVVRDVDGRDPKFSVELDQVGARLYAQLGIQVGQRFVHQKNLRLTNDSSTQRDSLALPSRKRFGLPVQKRADSQHVCRFADLSINIALDPRCFSPLHELLEASRQTTQPQPECHVVIHGHMRIKSVALEDHRDVSITRRNVGHGFVTDDNVSARRFLKARDHSESRRFSTPGRTNKDEKFAIANFEIEIVDRVHRFLGCGVGEGFL